MSAFRFQIEKMAAKAVCRLTPWESDGSGVATPVCWLLSKDQTEQSSVFYYHSWINFQKHTQARSLFDSIKLHF